MNMRAGKDLQIIKPDSSKAQLYKICARFAQQLITSVIQTILS